MAQATLPFRLEVQARGYRVQDEVDLAAPELAIAVDEVPWVSQPMARMQRLQLEMYCRGEIKRQEEGYTTKVNGLHLEQARNLGRG